MRISDWSSDVCSSDLPLLAAHTKLEGRISLQFQHDEGAVQLLIAQVEHGRGGSPETGLLVRGMAKANADAQGDFAALLKGGRLGLLIEPERGDRKSTRLKSSH